MTASCRGARGAFIPPLVGVKPVFNETGALPSFTASPLCSSDSSSPHPALLPGLLLFPGGYVRPDHVGDAPHPERLRAEVQGPHPLPRLVPLHTRPIHAQTNETSWNPLRLHGLFLLSDPPQSGAARWLQFELNPQKTGRPSGLVSVAGLVIRPNFPEIYYNKSDSRNYADYIKKLEDFLQSKAPPARAAHRLPPLL